MRKITQVIEEGLSFGEHCPGDRTWAQVGQKERSTGDKEPPYHHAHLNRNSLKVTWHHSLPQLPCEGGTCNSLWFWDPGVVL